jgi:hypothetical protein
MTSTMTNAMYQLTTSNSIKLTLPTGGIMFLPPQNNGTPEWREYQAWLEAGNTPEPAPEPEPAPVLTTEQKLEAAGLTVAELKELFGLT